MSTPNIEEEPRIFNQDSSAADVWEEEPRIFIPRRSTWKRYTAYLMSDCVNDLAQSAIRRDEVVLIVKQIYFFLYIYSRH